jgi:hypothetical protein
MTVRSYARVVALAGATAALIAGALALWLSAAAPSDAASADQVQDTAVTVVDRTISWGTAEDCVQDVGTADFGSVLPNVNLLSSVFNGCVTSNTSGWSVTASGTDLVPADASYSIPPPFVRTFAFTGSATGASAPCDSTGGACNLADAQTILSGGAAGTGGIPYQYSLLVPDNAPAGVYNGTVTFTASN